MEWITDPALLMGLFTLIILELVLGIDNLIFIAILAEKLPQHQQKSARIIGLWLALILRILMLASLSWIASLTQPLFTIFNKHLSGRDLILLIGGLFLLFKATKEIHERIEGSRKEEKDKIKPKFWSIIIQITLVDIVFSLDSVITAIGMVDELWVMVTAVIISMLIMMVASAPLSGFINRHPTLIILCLGFLLMIGFILISEGLGYHIPKGYVYTAISFSLFIEFLNQRSKPKQTK